MIRGSIHHRPLLGVALAPTAVTLLALLPLLVTGTGDRPPLILIAVFFLLAPLVALLVNWRWPQATTDRRAALAALPQLVIVMLMFRLAIWFEYRDYYLEDSSEEAMSYGIGFIVSLLLGVILFVLVYIAGRVGAWLGQR
jgi:hypothetical protein